MSLTMPRMPLAMEWTPWTDRRGRVHPLRTVVFALLLLPLAWLAVRGAGDLLGPRPVNAAIHSTGYWAAWIFLASLMVTPAKALLGRPDIVVVRRMIGNAALCYAAIHLLLYVIDQNWRLLTVAKEILVRPYLTIGFVAFAGLAVLGVTSTDGWVRRLGRDWKRLHKMAYGLAVLAMFHFFLQSKVDVSQATVAAGVFAWLMIWRVLPAGRDRGPAPLLLLAVAAGAMALLFEWAWYRFGTKVDPLKVVRAEFDVAFGFCPAALVLFLGLMVAALIELRNLAQTRFGATAGYPMLVFTLGAFGDDIAALAMGWSVADLVPEGHSVAAMNLAWVSLFALLGLARFRLRETWQRRWVDGLWAATVLSPILALATESRQVSLASAAVMIIGTLVLTLRVWPVSRSAAMLVAPLALFAAYEAAILL